MKCATKFIWSCACLLALACVLVGAEQNTDTTFRTDRVSIERGHEVFNRYCAACHTFPVGWTGPDEEINKHGTVYEGSIPTLFGNRKPPSSGYATLSPVFRLENADEALFVGGNF